MIARSVNGVFWQAQGGGPLINLRHVVAVTRSRPADPLTVITTVPGLTMTIGVEHAQEFLDALTGTTE